jgi:hypothetical protein
MYRNMCHNYPAEDVRTSHPRTWSSQPIPLGHDHDESTLAAVGGSDDPYKYPFRVETLS